MHERAKGHHEQEVAALRDAHARELEAAKTEHSSAVDEAKRAHEKAVGEVEGRVVVAQSEGAATAAALESAERRYVECTWRARVVYV